MSRGINRAILIGNVGNDPETKSTQGGVTITKISLATSSVRKGKDGQQVEKTDWHRVTFFGKLADVAGQYLRKGSQVYLEGRISYSESTGDDGQKRYYTDIIADQMQMLGGRGENGGGSASTPAPRQSRPKPVQATDAFDAGGFDDESIPFVTNRGIY